MFNPYLEKYQAICDEQGQYESFQHRFDLVNRYAWAIPDESACQKIAQYAPRIVEIGAGTGYWARMLSQVGVDVLAYDIQPYKNQWCEGHRWFYVRVGGPEIAADHPDRALFLCWPPYDHPMAFNALKAYQGHTLVYVGEDTYGCTGDQNFHDELSENWGVVDHIDIPQWFGIHDSIVVYKRKVR